MEPYMDQHICRKYYTPSSSRGVVLTRRVPLVEEKLLTLAGHLSSTPVFSVVRATRSLVEECIWNHT
jgi:hypothetical protein